LVFNTSLLAREQAAAFAVDVSFDWIFRRYAQCLGIKISSKRQQDIEHFPNEIAGLEVVLPLFFVGSAAIVAYGWVMQYHTFLAVPLILLFMMTFCPAAPHRG